MSDQANQVDTIKKKIPSELRPEDTLGRTVNFF